MGLSFRFGLGLRLQDVGFRALRISKSHEFPIDDKSGIILFDALLPLALNDGPALLSSTFQFCWQ